MRGAHPPAAIDRPPEDDRLVPAVREHLVDAYAQQFGGAGFPQPPRRGLPEADALGERQRVAEAEGHPHRGHWVVVASRVADQDPARRAAEDVSVPFKRQLDAAEGDAQAEGTVRRARGQAEGAPHDGGPPVGADDAIGLRGARFAVAREGDSVVLYRADPRPQQQLDGRLGLDRFTQARDDRRVLAGQAERSAAIGKLDRRLGVLREQDEPAAGRALLLPVELDPELPQCPDGGLVQPLSCQLPGRGAGGSLQQQDASALPGVRRCAALPSMVETLAAQW